MNRTAGARLGLFAPLLALLVLPSAGWAAGVTPVASPASDGAAPRPIVFPADSGPHAEAATEWWYYTGHLETEDGDRYGFEYVIFRAVRGDQEGYVAHFAVTDNRRGEFTYAQQIVGAEGVRGNRAALDLDLNGWTMRGESGRDRLRATMEGYAINLLLQPGKPPALHDGDGYIDYGNGTFSYYYSRTRMPVEGILTVGNEDARVAGTAWMDHQWGNFTTFEDGGWDWYALQLDDGTDLMLYLIHDGQGGVLRADGSLVAADGTVTTLAPDDFVVARLGTWVSPQTGTVWPQRWRIRVAPVDLDVTVTPTMPDQELDTRLTTGIIYWEGQSSVSGSKAGRPIGGRAYVELTGYAPVESARAVLPTLAPVTTP